MMEPYPSPPPGPPTLAQQKAFIVANGPHLNRETRLMILHLVLYGAESPSQGPGAASGAPAFCAPSPYGTNVDLDALGAAAPEVVGQIYNIAEARVRALGMPAC